MILTGSEIHNKVVNGEIVIDPFIDKQVNPNSYNFRLGKKIATYQNYVLDAKIDNEITIIEIPEEGMVLQPNIIYLGHTEEVMGSNHYAPIIRGRSSIGRLGLFVHITADLIDIGSINQWTLQLYAVQPVRIYAGMQIGQVTFWQPKGEIVLYDGKYQGSMGPNKSQIYLDFLKD
jgi:dCTP deaminase